MSKAKPILPSTKAAAKASRKPDPAIFACERLLAAERVLLDASSARDDAEARAVLSGKDPFRHSIEVNGHHCLTKGEVVRRSKALNSTEAQALIDTIRRDIADWEKRRRHAGLIPFDAAEGYARWNWNNAMEALKATHATTSAGVRMKLEIIEKNLGGAASAYGESILTHAIADLERMGAK